MANNLDQKSGPTQLYHLGGFYRKFQLLLPKQWLFSCDGWSRQILLQEKREEDVFLFFQTISAIINSMQQEKGHTNKEKLKSKFFAKRIWKIEYRLSCWEIFWFKIWPNKSAFLKLFLLVVLLRCGTVLQLFWNSKFSLKKFPTLDRWW